MATRGRASQRLDLGFPQASSPEKSETTLEEEDDVGERRSATG